MQKLIAFYNKHKTLFRCLAIVITVAVTAYAKNNVAFAAATAADSELSKTMQDLTETFYNLLQAASALLWPVLLMSGSLLDNDLIFGGAMGDRLLLVWVQIRNLVNIVFVLILLAIAVYNVLGLGEAGVPSLVFKTIIPKFVLALIVVNFSFLAVKVVLDFSNVIAGAVFALPATTGTDDARQVKARAEQLICGTESEKVPFRGSWCQGNSFNLKAQSLFNRLDRSNITLMYALRFGKAVQLKYVRGAIASITQFGFNIIFNAVLYVVYAVSFIVLFLVLLFRLVGLWIFVVLSPIIAVSIVLPNLKDIMGGEKDLKAEFINNAIVPIKIGLVLSVGYIMLSGLEADTSIHGEILASSITDIDPNAIPTDIDSLQQLLIAVGSVVIVWTGVFSAAEKSLAKGIVGTIKGGVEGFGKRIAKLPTYASVIPVKGKRESMAQIWGKLQEPMAMLEQRGRYQGFGANMDALGDAAKRGDVGKFAELIGSAPKTLTTQKGFDDLLRMVGNGRDTALEHRLSAMNSTQRQDARQIAQAIFSSNSKTADELKKALGGNVDEATKRIQSGTSLSSGGDTQQTPKTKALEQLKGGTLPSAKRSRWDNAQVASYRALSPERQIQVDEKLTWEGDKLVLTREAADLLRRLHGEQQEAERTAQAAPAAPTPPAPAAPTPAAPTPAAPAPAAPAGGPPAAPPTP